ncbi:MAG: hypothetical protein WBI34_03575 [Tenuifilaceae bacterium]|jgi:hypothetical protein|nr:hypothetical protein [Bacteroidales bacterium]MDI9516039.1 hypothetical protein [Bacteroidota bacterium]OQC64808.1 MAG: hypothetical protein BWX49_00368 [Bacteroidetes bacterium ADurb.Bin008]HNV81707.1 hypothetical protein [Tenuifilaceae bacterium]MZP81423.1 hypothetical protein [Bacteroidales bacterium]
MFKLFRTYINGSKKNEMKEFKRIFGENEENIDWVEYLRLFRIFMKDNTLVCKSRALLAKIVTHFIFYFFLLFNFYFSFYLNAAILILYLISFYVKNKLEMKLSRILIANEWAMSTIEHHVFLLFRK